MSSPTTVVCGADGSAPSREAIAQAVRSAAGRGARLRVVAAFDPPDRMLGWRWGPAGGVILPTDSELAAAIRTDVTATVSSVLDALGDELPMYPAIEVVVEAGPASSVLLAESEDAAELVVGHRGRGALSTLGSVALACLHHASCPVTVVPGVHDRGAARSVSGR
jgi:nucleotide-binding universal stress UspA family protein